MAASLGTATFIKPNGRTLSIDIEVQDAAGALATWDSGAGGATGQEYWQYPEELSLVHLSLVNVTTATALRVIVNGTPTNNVIRHNINCVTTLIETIAGRAPLNIGFAAGAKIALIGVA